MIQFRVRFKAGQTRSTVRLRVQDLLWFGSDFSSIDSVKPSQLGQTRLTQPTSFDVSTLIW
ncbi:hypothetical protein Hanom_Chr01g00039371 [Helianthus anomalus]